MRTITMPSEFVTLANHWHSGQSSMLYAVSSTGSLTRGSIRPIGDDGAPMSDQQWESQLWRQLASEVKECLDDTDGSIDADVTIDRPGLRRFLDYATRTADCIDNGHDSDPETELAEFLDSYIETALWSSMDFADESGGEPLDANYSRDDIAPETLAEMESDCRDFLTANRPFIIDDLSRAGHDFWLTRNGHGAGFWDGDWPEHGDALTEACKPYGSYDLYIGDDGMIHGS